MHTKDTHMHCFSYLMCVHDVVVELSGLGECVDGRVWTYGSKVSTHNTQPELLEGLPFLMWLGHGAKTVGRLRCGDVAFSFSAQPHFIHLGSCWLWTWSACVGVWALRVMAVETVQCDPATSLADSSHFQR